MANDTKRWPIKATIVPKYAIGDLQSYGYLGTLNGIYVAGNGKNFGKAMLEILKY